MEKIIYSMSLEDFKTVIKSCIRDEINLTKAESQTDGDLIKSKDAKKLLGVSIKTLSEWRRKGILPYYRIASRIYYKKSELLEALNTVPGRRRRGKSN